MPRNSTVNTPIEEPATIRRMFDSIAPTYDLLNHLLSFGFDIRWRKKAIQLLEEKRGGAILDIACGSGDLSLEALQLAPRRIVATDFAPKMLDVFRQKLEHRHPTPPVELAVCDALALPFEENSFDATMVAFGIRNFGDRLQSLREMRRVLAPNGIALILELSTPKTRLMRRVHKVHATVVLPLIGKIISRHNEAYRYLPESISHFPSESDFIPLMKEAGFSSIQTYALTFGVAIIYLGRKTE